MVMVPNESTQNILAYLSCQEFHKNLAETEMNKKNTNNNNSNTSDNKRMAYNKKQTHTQTHTLHSFDQVCPIV